MEVFGPPTSERSSERSFEGRLAKGYTPWVGCVPLIAKRLPPNDFNTVTLMEGFVKTIRHGP